MMAYVAPVLGGLALGYGYGNIGGVTSNSFFSVFYEHPSEGTLQLLNGAVQLGSVLGSIFGGIGMDVFGRRGFCLFASVLLLLGTLAVSVPLVAETWTSLLPLFVGRLLFGLANGVICCALPAYVSEVSLPEIRGRAEASFQFATEIGILAAYIFNWATLTRTANGWRWSLALQVPVALCLLLGMALLPESPRWLLLQKQDPPAAQRALERLRRGTGQEALLEEMQAMEPTEEEKSRQSVRWSEVCTWKCFVAMVVLAMQVGTGIDMVTVYAPDIFQEVLHGGSEQDSLTQTIWVGVTFILFTPLTMLLIDRVGRKPLLLTGSAGMALSLWALALPIEMGGVWNMVFVLAFVAFFAFSVGPIAWVIPSEMVNSRVRARVLGLGTVANWLADYFVVSTYFSLKSAAGQHGAFAVYAVVNTCTALFILFFVPETKGIELDH